MTAAAGTAERVGAIPAEKDAGLARFARQVLAHHGPWSVEEFLELPEWGNRTELVDGTLLMSPRPDGAHQRAMRNLATLLEATIPADWEVLTEINLQAGSSTVLQPDLTVFTHAHIATIYQAADAALVVEIASPSSRRLDRSYKFDAYAAAGIEWYMLVDVKGRNAPWVALYRLKEDAYAEHARAHAGQKLELTEPVKLSFDPAVLLHPHL